MHPVLPDEKPADHARTPTAALEEAVGLAEAIHLKLDVAHIFKPSKTRPSTLIGAGQVEQIAADAKEHKSDVIIINHSLSALQQRNLERESNCKVIDRTALILEIFGERAQTREGQLQVELAALDYQKGRLVRSWTHLERQRGGLGFVGGPGESQIELDRRMIADRIVKIKKQLDKVMQTRSLHRKQRDSVPYPTVALAGYTNAGKSTLFNRLTGAKVMAEDQLFATLDPTIRRIRLPSGITPLMSDTVGFISNLPTELIAAFRATLEEVTHADVILHVRDMACKDTESQKADVEAVLKDVFGKTKLPPILEVWNKLDLVEELPLPLGEVDEAQPNRERANFFHYQKPQLIDNARQLRHDQTEPEAILWSILRKKQLGVKFRRQHPFDKYVLDFYCHEEKLAIELDGGQHGEDGAKSYDKTRTDYLESHGITVLRFWNNDITENLEGVFDTITSALSRNSDAISTSPTGRGKDYVAVSAMTGENIDGLRDTLDELIAEHCFTTLKLVLPADSQEKISWLYNNGHIVSYEVDEENRHRITARLSKAAAERFTS